MTKRKADELFPDEHCDNVTSGVYEEDHSFRWKIENFEVVRAISENMDKQRFCFTAGESHGHPTKWVLGLLRQLLQLKRIELLDILVIVSEFRGQKTIGIYLSLVNAPQEFNTLVSYTFHRVKPTGELCTFYTVQRKLFVAAKPCKLIPEGPINELIWSDGSIVIQVDFKLFIWKPVIRTATELKGLNEQIATFEETELRTLSKSMREMLQVDSQQEVGKIIKIVTKDQKNFFVKTDILSARSPVFRAMFDSGKWKEGQGSLGGEEQINSLVLKDLSGKTVKVLLHYLYGGILLTKEWRAEDVIVELVWAAQKYQLESLTEFLDNVLAVVPLRGTEIIAKLAMLTKRLGMRKAEKELFARLKNTATDIDQLILDKDGPLFETD